MGKNKYMQNVCIFITFDVKMHNSNKFTHFHFDFFAFVYNWEKLIKIYILNPIRKDEIYTHSFKIPFSKHHFNNQNIIRKNKYLLKFITVT